MVKSVLILAAILAATVAGARDAESYDGYSYFSVGVQSMSYEEHNPTYDSLAKVTNPIYRSGSLLKITDTIDISLDFLSTVVPNETEETWKKNGNPFQTNKVQVIFSSIEGAVQYKVTQNHRLLAGFGYSLNSYKRYDINRSTTTESVIEELISSLKFQVGYAYESRTAGIKGWRISGRAIAGLPIFQQATNTLFPGATFNDTEGYDLNALVSLGYTVYTGLEIGVYGGYNYSYKKGSQQEYQGGTLSWPENYFKSYEGGVQLSWHLDN